MTKYNEFVDRLKTGHVYTHSGGFHADEVVATALINKVCEKEGLEYPEVHRISNKSEAENMSANHIVYDIGFGEYDHHQEDNEVRENEIPYAACGKIFRVVGEELYGEYAEKIEKEFIQGIDECDNTERDSMYSKMIRDLNPNWDEDININEAFNDAVRLAEQTLNERYELAYEGKNIDVDTLTQVEQDIYERGDARKEASSLAAEKVIEKSMKEGYYETKDKNGKEYKILNLEKPGVPYPKIKEMTADTPFVGYTFPSRGSISYKPLDQDKLAVPEEWQGKQSEELPEGINFCAKAGISVGCDSIEDCYKAIESMIEIQDNIREQQKKDLETVKQNPYALVYFENQTPEICMEVVKQNCGALQCVKNQTPEICMAAVKKDWSALKYVKEQTPEICMVAVKESGEALKYVKEQTPEMCMEAVKQDSDALDYVKDKAMRETVKEMIEAEQSKDAGDIMDLIEDNSELDAATTAIVSEEKEINEAKASMIEAQKKEQTLEDAEHNVQENVTEEADTSEADWTD